MKSIAFWDGYLMVTVLFDQFFGGQINVDRQLTNIELNGS